MKERKPETRDQKMGRMTRDWYNRRFNEEVVLETSIPIRSTILKKQTQK